MKLAFVSVKWLFVLILVSVAAVLAFPLLVAFCTVDDPKITAHYLDRMGYLINKAIRDDIRKAKGLQ